MQASEIINIIRKFLLKTIDLECNKYEDIISGQCTSNKYFQSDFNLSKKNIKSIIEISNNTQVLSRNISYELGNIMVIDVSLKFSQNIEPIFKETDLHYSQVKLILLI